MRPFGLRFATSAVTPIPMERSGLRYDPRRQITNLVNPLGLRFDALDFIVTPSGEWVFLEANPNGQFAWLQDTTGVNHRHIYPI